MSLGRYLRLIHHLLLRREVGELTTEEEGEIAERLDDLWRPLSKEEQESIDRRVEKMRANPSRIVLIKPGDGLRRTYPAGTRGVVIEHHVADAWLIEVPHEDEFDVVDAVERDFEWIDEEQ